jgi:hypothetical protein
MKNKQFQSKRKLCQMEGEKKRTIRMQINQTQIPPIKKLYFLYIIFTLNSKQNFKKIMPNGTEKKTDDKNANLKIF